MFGEGVNLFSSGTSAPLAKSARRRQINIAARSISIAEPRIEMGVALTAAYGRSTGAPPERCSFPQRTRLPIGRLMIRREIKDSCFTKGAKQRQVIVYLDWVLRGEFIARR